MEIEEIYNKLDWNAKLRCLNYCEVEFGFFRYYGRNNIQDVKEALITEFECTTEEVIDILYNNKDFHKEDEFFITNGRYLHGISQNQIEDDFEEIVLHNLCNGELRQIIEDETQEKINY